MSEKRGQRVMGWAVGKRSAWVEEVHEYGRSSGFVVRTHDRSETPDRGITRLGEFCFDFNEAAALAKNFVSW